MHALVVALLVWVTVSVIVSPFIGIYLRRAANRQGLGSTVRVRPVRGSTVMSEQAAAQVSRAAQEERRPAHRR